MPIIDDYSNQDVNIKLRTFVDLVNLYPATNLKVIQQKKKNNERVTRSFIQFTKVLCGIRDTIYKLNCNLVYSYGARVEISLSQYYMEGSNHFCEYLNPEIMNSQQNKNLLSQFEKLIIKFTKIIVEANAPVNLFCCRCNCCFLTYKNLFHVND